MLCARHAFTVQRRPPDASRTDSASCARDPQHPIAKILDHSTPVSCLAAAYRSSRAKRRNSDADMRARSIRTILTWKPLFGSILFMRFDYVGLNLGHARGQAVCIDVAVGIDEAGALQAGAGRHRPWR